MTREEAEIATLLEMADLDSEVQFEIVNLEGKVDVKLYSKERYVCLLRDEAHQILEECVLSKNAKGYFWYLADKLIDNRRKSF